jgi:acyl-CoA synthetase (AMP-forming)/AMP-acid ligase II
VTLETLTDFAERSLARYKRPRHLMLVDALPRTDTGKVARQRLRDLFAQRTGNNADLGEFRPVPLAERPG